MSLSTLSVVIPCYNEAATLKKCIERVNKIADPHLALEIVIVDDYSTDQSLQIAKTLAEQFPHIRVVAHTHNQGKGAALRTGFKEVSGDFVAVQDADLEYDPMDLKRLVRPLEEGVADVVLGSRFAASGVHRVLYFWHSLGNRFLTFLSNMFTDLNLTDMETCYKVFKREVIQGIEIQENRFGFEPEIVAKIAQRRLRIFETGISYYGRTYAEGKKINAKDGFRALYCIFKYNLPHAPMPIQFLIYCLIGGTAALINLGLFLLLMSQGLSLNVAAPAAFGLAAVFNYLLCITLLFRHRARWNTVGEVLIFIGVVCVVGLVDWVSLHTLVKIGLSNPMAKLLASLVGLWLNFLGRRFLVFPETCSGPWCPGTVMHEGD